MTGLNAGETGPLRTMVKERRVNQYVPWDSIVSEMA